MLSSLAYRWHAGPCAVLSSLRWLLPSLCVVVLPVDSLDAPALLVPFVPLDCAVEQQDAVYGHSDVFPACPLTDELPSEQYAAASLLDQSTGEACFVYPVDIYAAVPIVSLLPFVASVGLDRHARVARICAHLLE